MSNRDLLLDLKTHDLVRENFDLKIVSGVAATRQRLKVRLQLFLKEWFLDQTAGVPFYDAIFVKNPDVFLIESVLKSAILSTPRVQTLTAFELDFDNGARRLFVNFSVTTEDGPINGFADSFQI